MKRQARLLRAVLLTTLFAGVTTVFLPSVAARKRAPEQAGQAADEKTRVYVTDSQSWESIGGWGISGQRTRMGAGALVEGDTQLEALDLRLPKLSSRSTSVARKSRLQITSKRPTSPSSLTMKVGKDIYSIATKSPV